MWQLNSIQAQNFQSYKALNYCVINNMLSMVFGQNLDISEKRSNGSGKSVLLDIIAFAITGDCLRKVKTLKEIINNAEEECFAEIELENKVLKKKLKIKRFLSLKKSQKIEIYEHDLLLDQFKDLHQRESEKYIQEQLGISFDDLINYYLISKYKYQSLFLANDASKKEVINRFSKASIIDNIFPFFEDDLKLVNDEFVNLTTSLVEQTAKIQVYEQQIEELLNGESEHKKQEKIKEIESQIKDKKQVIITLNQAIEDINGELMRISDSIADKYKELIKDVELKRWDDTIKINNNALESNRVEYKNVRKDHDADFNALADKQDEKRQLIKQHEINVKEFEKEIKELESYIAGEIECPKCKYHFILADKDFDVENAKNIVNVLQIEKNKEDESIKDADKFLMQIKLDIEKVEKIIIKKQDVIQVDADKLKTELNKLESQKLELTRKNNKVLAEISELERQVKSKEQSIKLKESQIGNENHYIEQYQDNIEEEKKDKTKEAIKELNDKVEDEAVKKQAIQDNADKLTLDISKLEEWKIKFKRFKSFLANQALSQIQQQANYYLNKMKSELFISIDGFRELSSGKLKEEITVEISRDGLNSESFGKFSGGEKSICDLSSILAMQNIINSTSQTGGLQFLGIDEICESVDAEGMNDIVKCLNDLNQTILLIAHSSPDESFDVNKLIIEKKNGISKIINKN